MPISVSIVEDHQEYRESLSALLDKAVGFTGLSAHGSAEEALAELPQLRPNVVLMDINLPGINGVECVRQIKPQLTETQVIMLTTFQNTEYIFSALAAGATGYLLKQTPPDELLEAIRMVHDGGSPMSGHIARKIVQLFHQPVRTSSHNGGHLSTREAQILELLAKGYFYKEIAVETKLAYATVHTHIRNIYKKLQVRSRTEAVTRHLGMRSLRHELGGIRL